MNKVISILTALLVSTSAFAIDPTGSRIDYEDKGIDVPVPLLLIGLILATIASFWMGSLKDKDGKRNSPGMIWLGIIGLLGLFFIIGYNT